MKGLTLKDNFKPDSDRRRVFSGMQPTGAAHLGNYLGALANWVALQDQNDCVYCIVDLHSMTMPWEPRETGQRSLELAASVVACGVDPERAILFRQSRVHQHSELAWILTCIARMGELRRMIQFKERSRGETEAVGAGLFTYPVLQAADVLLYQAHGVPVGEDQRQHIELMRDLALRFNSAYGRTFVAPDALIPGAGARVMALDDPTQKMSKSASRPNSVILLSDPPELIAKKVQSAVTDSGRDVTAGPEKPAIANLLTIMAVIERASVEELEQRFAGAGYAEFKRALADSLIDHLNPIRLAYERYVSDPAEVDKILARGAERASEIAETTMRTVWERVGLGRRPD